jgi:hypothetical protein
MDKKLLAGLSPAYALSQGKLPISATFDMLKNGLGDSDKAEDAEKERDDYKKQLAAMQAAQTPQAPAPAAQVYTPRMKAGGKVSSASKRADGIAKKGKTRGRMV